MQIGNVEKFVINGKWRRIFKADLYRIRVKELIGDVTSGLTRPLSAEIVFPPFSALGKVV
jgi:hypothetical protein